MTSPTRERPLDRRPRDAEPYCQHWRLSLDHDVERVYCRDCKREVPAFKALEELARHWDRFIVGRKEAERRMLIARENLAELLRAEANAKARTRAARKRGDPEVVKALRELVRIVKRDRRGAGPADHRAANAEAYEALQAAELALYRHGQQRAREGEELPARGTATPAAEGDVF